MTNPPILVITGLGGYFILNFLQKSGLKIKRNVVQLKGVKQMKGSYSL